MTTARFIVTEPRLGQHSGTCGVCGQPSDQAWARTEILQKTTSNTTVTFPFNTDAICEYCVVMWECGRANPWNRGLLAIPGRVWFPLIAENAEISSPDRPTWANALRSLNPALPRVVVLTTDFKKRVWPRARISQGDTLSLLLHDTSRGISDNRDCSLSKLLSVLDFVEEVYTLGFSKASIESGLFSVQKQVAKVGWAKTAELEKQLQALRKLPELVPATLIAQKKPE